VVEGLPSRTKRLTLAHGQLRSPSRPGIDRRENCLGVFALTAQETRQCHDTFRFRYSPYAYKTTVIRLCLPQSAIILTSRVDIRHACSGIVYMKHHLISSLCAPCVAPSEVDRAPLIFRAASAGIPMLELSSHQRRKLWVCRCAAAYLVRSRIVQALDFSVRVTVNHGPPQLFAAAGPVILQPFPRRYGIMLWEYGCVCACVATASSCIRGRR